MKRLLAMPTLGTVTLVPSVNGSVPGSAAGGHPSVSDTAGVALVQWSYDTWTVPWSQVRGDPCILDPGSHATFMALTCETSRLERERMVRHLSAEECEHRMAAMRAEHDTALIFRMDLRLSKGSRSKDLLESSRRMTAVLEASDGWRWSEPRVERGLRLGMATGQKARRLWIYHPQWTRGSDFVHENEYTVSPGRPTTLVEYWLRFPKRDPVTGEPVLTRSTRWLRLRLSDGRSEWVATWPFLPDEERAH